MDNQSKDQDAHLEPEGGEQRPWYKKPWGMLIAILFLPYFLVWYAWAKSSWSKNLKIAVTATVGILVVGLFAAGAIQPQQEPSRQAVDQPIQNKEIKKEYVFDVPALIGKNIDEVRAVLGQPIDNDPEPTQQQNSLGAYEWYNSFKKGEDELLVTYNSNNREVIDFFLEGDNKEELFKKGNLKDSHQAYEIEVVKSTKGVMTGIKIIPKN